VALTFDDGPSLKYTPKILAILKKYHVPATFFVLGSCAKRAPHLLKAIVEEGHVLANHAYSHRSLPKLSSSAQQEELNLTNALLTPYQEKISFFRPPYGATNASIQGLATTLGMDTVLWSIDTLDWKKPSPARMQKRVLSELKPGAIILMHDIHENTVLALEGMIQAILRAGYRIVPLL
jgi:peptidoglycan/xylan/chitin deacetylase (PgdA/CDA1 family)